MFKVVFYVNTLKQYIFKSILKFLKFNSNLDEVILKILNVNPNKTSTTCNSESRQDSKRKFLVHAIEGSLFYILMWMVEINFTISNANENRNHSS